MSSEWILSSSGLILLILLVRYLFRKKLPPCLQYALWLVVALRLLLPFSISGTAVSILNLLPQQDRIWEDQENRTGQTTYERKEEPDDIPEEADLVSLPGEAAVGKNAEAENGKEKTGTVKTEKEEGIESFFSNVKNMDISKVFKGLWLLGAGVCGSIFLFINLDYRRKLGRSRKSISSEKLPVMCEIPVYETQMTSAPCLFGLLFPAIYVREDTVKEEKTFLFVLCHEHTHYRQHDHWWALVRIGCICVHWFNPLVWLAFGLSRQDAEMACDERTLRILGDKARVDYGKTLLELSVEKDFAINSLRISTTMSGSARQMKERLVMIVKAPVRTIGIQILMLILVIFLSMITFTGKSMAKERENLNAESLEIGNAEEGSIDIENMDFAGTDQLAETQQADDPEEISEADKEMEAETQAETQGGTLTMDLNFDGWDDLCIQRADAGGADILYDCMLWNPENDQYEYSATLYHVEVDAQQQWIVESTGSGGSLHSTTYYRYDENDQLHMVRYIEEDSSPDAVFANLDLTYVEDDGPYTLSTIVDGTELHRALILMAKQSLVELYQWTGEKVDTACFQVTNMGDVYFGITPEDIRHSRIFYDRAFGADTEYNLSNYEKSISSMYVTSGRSVWYSPVLWRSFPEQMDEMTDEEIIIWYLERTPLVKDCKVKSIEKRYVDMWTIQTEDDVWFEVSYDTRLKEIGMVLGPYPEYPAH